MTSKRTMTAEGAELLKSVKQMKARRKGRVYTPEQLLAISARQSVNLTQKEFAQLLDVSVDSVQIGNRDAAHHVVPPKLFCVSPEVIPEYWRDSIPEKPIFLP